MNNPCMELKVSFLAGTDIKDAVQQSIDMLQLLPMLAYVKFDFNGIKVCVNRRSTTENLTERLSKAYDDPMKHWIA